MKYYHVRLTNQTSQELVVNAGNPEEAKRLAAQKLSGADIPQALFLREDVNAAIDIAETNRAGWMDALAKKEEETKNNGN